MPPPEHARDNLEPLNLSEKELKQQPQTALSRELFQKATYTCKVHNFTCCVKALMSLLPQNKSALESVLILGSTELTTTWKTPGPPSVFAPTPPFPGHYLTQTQIGFTPCCVHTFALVYRYKMLYIPILIFKSGPANFR